ncbi:L,D-transpeptidase [Rhizobium sp. BK251]|uniref:L,D-transpeptidase n=1 Tax=Rhizobium sp. BK251 TaxID=2512125 RepID=UPI0010CFDF4F|nr:L,D-transpeptidase [Rhizobium sp. BK251]TCL69514.1 lipoprotein-anchoring transpeptidase ErfK/SrfK [Rhizobium sp. BK251]
MTKLFQHRLARRALLASGAATFFSWAVRPLNSQEVIKDIAELKPGQFVWHPERQLDGPVAIVVSLPEQRVHVYRNGIRIALSTCSTGRPGHETPTGVFVVLQKDPNHHSSTYDDAPMPFMNRLTWSGIALHAGALPGYPASHGCVRLPMDFANKLYTVTHLGTPVIIAGSQTDPWELTHPGMVLSGYTEDEFKQVVSSLDAKKPPSDWADGEKHPIVSVIASSADRKILMLQEGDIIAEGSLTVQGSGPLGSHVFVLRGAHEGQQGMAWFAISYNSAASATIDPDEKALNRLTADPDFLAKLQANMHPGMMLVLTDLPLDPDTRTGKDFVIMS